MAAEVLIDVLSRPLGGSSLPSPQRMGQLALVDPEGQVLQVYDQAILPKGRPLLAQTLTQAVVQRIEATEKSLDPPMCLETVAKHHFGSRFLRETRPFWGSETISTDGKKKAAALNHAG